MANCTDKKVMVMKVDLWWRKSLEDARASEMLANMFAMLLLMSAWPGLW